jgi:hypothetical protein
MTFKLIKNNFPFFMLVLLFASCQSAKQNENNEATEKAEVNN